MDGYTTWKTVSSVYDRPNGTIQSARERPLDETQRSSYWPGEKSRMENSQRNILVFVRIASDIFLWRLDSNWDLRAEWEKVKSEWEKWFGDRETRARNRYFALNSAETGSDSPGRRLFRRFIIGNKPLRISARNNSSSRRVNQLSFGPVENKVDVDLINCQQSLNVASTAVQSSKGSPFSGGSRSCIGK